MESDTTTREGVSLLHYSKDNLMSSLPVVTSRVTIGDATFTVSELTLRALENFIAEEAKAIESKSGQAVRDYRLSVIAWSLNRASALEGEAAHTVESLKNDLGLKTVDAIFNEVLKLSNLKNEDGPQSGEASASRSG
jgi:hypothetical protein